MLTQLLEYNLLAVNLSVRREELIGNLDRNYSGNFSEFNSRVSWWR